MTVYTPQVLYVLPPSADLSATALHAHSDTAVVLVVRQVANLEHERHLVLEQGEVGVGGFAVVIPGEPAADAHDAFRHVGHAKHVEGPRALLHRSEDFVKTAQPGYQDGRYWMMWKLPMYGCNNPGQVLDEIQQCKRAYPNAYIRMIGFDSVRQVQCLSFIVSKPPGY